MATLQYENFGLRGLPNTGIDHRELIAVVQMVAQEKDLKATVKYSTQGALITGGSAFLGSLALGPVGLAIGGIVGGMSAFALSKDKYKSVVEIVGDMPEQKKELLARRLALAFRNFGVENVIGIATFVMTSVELKELVVKELGMFLLNEMSYQLAKQ